MTGSRGAPGSAQLQFPLTMCSTSTQRGAFNRPCPILIPSQAMDDDAPYSDGALDQCSGRKLQQGSSSCSHASVYSHHAAKRHKSARNALTSPATGLPSPAFRCLFSEDDTTAVQQVPIRGSLDCSHWPGSLAADPPSIASDDRPHRKGLEQWLNKMEQQVIGKSGTPTPRPSAVVPVTKPAAGTAPAVGPKTPGADLPAPAFVLLGLLSS